MNLKVLVALVCVTLAGTSAGQQRAVPFADSAFVFKGFSEGGSTNNIINNSRRVDTITKTARLKLDIVNLDTLNFLLSQVKSKRHFQQKLGPVSFYASVFKNGKEWRIAVLPGWGIINLENRQEFNFRKTLFFTIYNRFVERNSH